MVSRVDKSSELATNITEFDNKVKRKLNALTRLSFFV